MRPEPDAAELKRRLETRIAELAAAQKRIEEMREQLTRTRGKLKAILEERDALKGSAEYRLGRKLVQPFRKLFRKLGAKKPPIGTADAAAPDRIPYHDWRLAQIPSQSRMREESARDPSLLISIVIPVQNPVPQMLEEAVASVRSQAYERWELIAMVDGSSNPEVRSLLDSMAGKDPRIVISFMDQGSRTVLASNAALAMARGEFIGWLDQNDWLEPDALFEITRRMVEFPDVDFLYSDEDKVDERGHFQQPFFKSGWDPDAMLSCNYCGHFTAIRRSLVNEIGGFREGFDGADDYDLFLRATERARRIVHIPRVLYHSRIGAGPRAAGAAMKPESIEAGTRRSGMPSGVAGSMPVWNRPPRERCTG